MVNVICEAVEEILRVQWGQETCLWVWQGRLGGCQGVPGGQEGIQGIPWGHRVGLMSLLMIHKAYMPVYKWSRFFLRDGRDGTNEPTEGSTRGPRGPKNRSSWLNCALRDDEAVYWVSIGHYEALAIGNWLYWVSRGHLCLYILNQVMI